MMAKYRQWRKDNHWMVNPSIDGERLVLLIDEEAPQKGFKAREQLISELGFYPARRVCSGFVIHYLLQLKGINPVGHCTALTN